MAPKFFITGITGYIGGTASDIIINAHPEYEITALVRSEAKASSVKALYPHVKTVLGDLDSDQLLQRESAAADIVLHFADADHVKAATSITTSLSSSSTPKFLIHTSGTGILPDLTKPERGNPITPEERYSDIDSISTITSLSPQTHLHRNVDTIIQSSSPNVKTAIVCPPTIYGPGLGAGNLRSIQIPNLVLKTLERGKGLSVAGGRNSWNHVHVRDLGRLYLKLVEAAVKGGEGADWGKEGYYFAESGEHVWGEISKVIATKVKEKGFSKTDEVEDLTVEEADKVTPWGAYLWGTNSVGKADRARKVLGWEPKELSLVDTLDAVIEEEAAKLGLKK